MGVDILVQVDHNDLKIHFCVDRTVSAVTIIAKKDEVGDYCVSLDKAALVALMSLIGHDIFIHDTENEKNLKHKVENIGWGDSKERPQVFFATGQPEEVIQSIKITTEVIDG